MLVLRSGGDFNFRDVEVLSYHLHLYWQSEDVLKVYCLYDKIDQVFELKNCILIPMPNKEWVGWWSKMNLFAPALDVYRPFLFMDLDTAVIGPYSDLFSNDFKGILGLEDFYRPNNFASGVMGIPSNDEIVTGIWKEWMKNPELHIKKYRGDQNFISNFILSNKYWQYVTDKICSFKVRGSDKTWLMEVPKNISIVCFHGFPRIKEAVYRTSWIKEYLNV